jgi:hypothetical protein
MAEFDPKLLAPSRAGRYFDRERQSDRAETLLRFGCSNHVAVSEPERVARNIALRVSLEDGHGRIALQDERVSGYPDQRCWLSFRGVASHQLPVTDREKIRASARLQVAANILVKDLRIRRQGGDVAFLNDGFRM